MALFKKQKKVLLSPEEYKLNKIDNLVKNSIKEFKAKSLINLVFSSVISTLIILLNIALLILAILALLSVIHAQGLDNLVTGDDPRLVLPVLVAFFIINLFIFSIVLVIYKSIVSFQRYHNACEELQYLLINFNCNNLNIAQAIKVLKNINSFYSNKKDAKVFESIKKYLAGDNDINGDNYEI